MKRITKITVTALVAIMVVAFFGVFLQTADAATGNWNSTWQTDLNGVSGVGTSNASNSASFTLRVIGNAGVSNPIGTATVTIGRHQSASRNFWGVPFQSRRGSVLVSSITHHVPWFNA
ncbi:MAG: hypothetical protein FWG67_04635 [Defluviitaleaceae bacterium]|nr:hypothetical protein [Defluviitaleaceae bacterium]